MEAQLAKIFEIGKEGLDSWIPAFAGMTTKQYRGNI